MSLAEDLHRILEHFHLTHIPALTNQGCATAVEHHLAQLAAVAGDVQRGDEAAMRVLGELYGASDSVPATEAAPSAPVVLGEHDTELPVPAEVAPPADPVPADIAVEAHAAVAEAEQPADEPAHDEPQDAEAAA